MNPAWNEFVNEVVAAKIKDELFLEFSFTPSLYKLLLYKTGSFFKPHRDSEKVNGMFATLVIQLPSFYKGGQLIVRHDGKIKTSDFSSTNSNNSFDTFFTAFYCDCEHEVLKVTDGYRVCLVYNLISNRSVVPTAPRRYASELELVEILKDWKHRGKLVYALKHKYSESNLAFDNLKSTDKAIANFLITIAKANDLSVSLGIFNKESSGQGDYGDFNFGRSRRYGYGREDSDVDADFDSSDDDFCHEKRYSLSKLTSVDGDNITSLTVNFKKEVIPEDCFANIEPYHKTAEPTGNAGVDITKYYRSAAIVFWPKQFYLEVLREGGAASDELDKVFLKEIESHRGLVKSDRTETKLRDWANELISSGDNKSRQVIRAIVEMKDIELMQSLFSKCVHLNTVSVSLLVDVCEEYGWTTFSTQIPQMFEKLTRELGIQLLAQISTANMVMEKKNIVHDVFKVILKKDANISPSSSSSYFTWYVRPPTMEEKMVKRLEEQEFLLSACRLAEKVNFDMLDFAKSKSVVLFVPVLLQLVPKESTTLTSFWKNIALHFLQQMQTEAAKPVVVTNWRRHTKINCSCGDCSSLNGFLTSDQETISFKMGKDRRKHLHQSMNRMQDISHETDRSGHIGVLVIKKTTKSGAEESETRTFSTENLSKLRVILPSR